MFRAIWLHAAAAVLLLAAARGIAGAAAPDQSPSKLTAPPKLADALLSPSTAARFWQIGWELSQLPSLTEAQADQAIVFLVAAKSLDPRTPGVEPVLIELATGHSSKNYSQHVLLWLQSYVGAAASNGTAAAATVDYRLVKQAIQYLVDRRSSPEERRKLLEDLVAKIGNRHPAIDSELATMLGQLMLEQGDRNAAKFYFIQAYRKSKYNTTAFAGLGEVAPEELSAAASLECLRLAIRQNPTDLETALAFANYAERLQLHDLAVRAFQYCADVHRYLHPKQPWPSRIYLPWASAAYNSNAYQSAVLQIAQIVRKNSGPNVVLEAIAGKAAAKLGRVQDAQQILVRAEQYALQWIPRQDSQSGPESTPVSIDKGPMQMAWFYCFAMEDPTKALNWAHRCYTTDANSPTAIALLAYSLAMTGQWDLVREAVRRDSAKPSQITLLATAQLQIERGNRDQAASTLRSAIAKDPASLPAEKARKLLLSLGEKYADPDMTATQAVLTRTFGPSLVPRFTAPGQALEAQLTLPSNEFAYGLDIMGTVSILNTSQESLVVTDQGLFTGRIRIDARVDGYMQESFPNLVVQTLGAQVEVPPGGSVTAPVCLSTGPLRRFLVDRPQATFRLEFTLYLDPVETEGGATQCKLADVKPVVCTIARPGVDISGDYMQARFNAIVTGQEAQKAFTSRLFVGLINEQAMMEKAGRSVYKYHYADWIKDMTRAAFTHDAGLLLGPTPDEWPVKVHAMADLLGLKLDQQLATVAARNLNDPKWPVRLMTLYLLSANGGAGFDKMLDWIAQSETDPLVRGMGAALRSK